MREICTDALDALTMQHSGGALHFGAQRMSSGQLGLCFAHEKLLHPAGCRRAGGCARTGGGAGEPPVVRGDPSVSRGRIGGVPPKHLWGGAWCP